ncbi:vWA domain-containing protein [Egicoccus halophilus]|uniref:VWA domain-containing protein n=1 Tax=Egicoccus halophilus TaxID=1670830 RepID=A0A8J3AAS2_9ACTN|nr:VWA domain-containing protein [Egicoccus halophilus]GGI03407.1 VWA domain-containing protein [Egicoccus halophilus]
MADAAPPDGAGKQPDGAGSSGGVASPGGGATPGGGAATSLAPVAVGFARALRAAGVDADPTRVHAFVAALDVLAPERTRDVYWAGRLTLCSGPDDLARYDRVFAAFFAGVAVPGRARTARRVQVTAAALATPGSGTADDEAPTVTAVTRHASAYETLRHRDVARLDDHERAELHRLLRAFSLPGELRRTRRRQPARRGPVDRRRTVRALLAAGGEPGRLHRTSPRPRPRRVVLLVDVSGSMAGYADALLRFAHAAVRARRAPTEVFTLGTRLTRVTSELAHRDAETAMRAVSAAIPDWSGGTRLGATLREFLDRWGQRGVARGAVVVVLSDGWETGDPDELATQVRRLSRLAHRLVWANPRAGRPGFAPTAGGMAAALPYCDAFQAGHSLASLEALAAVVAGAATDPPARQHDVATGPTLSAQERGGRDA